MSNNAKFQVNNQRNCHTFLVSPLSNLICHFIPPLLPIFPQHCTSNLWVQFRQSWFLNDVSTAMKCCEKLYTSTNDSHVHLMLQFNQLFLRISHSIIPQIKQLKLNENIMNHNNSNSNSSNNYALYDDENHQGGNNNFNSNKKNSSKHKYLKNLSFCDYLDINQPRLDLNIDSVKLLSDCQEWKQLVFMFETEIDKLKMANKNRDSDGTINNNCNTNEYLQDKELLLGVFVNIVIILFDICGFKMGSNDININITSGDRLRSNVNNIIYLRNLIQNGFCGNFLRCKENDNNNNKNNKNKNDNDNDVNLHLPIFDQWKEFLKNCKNMSKNKNKNKNKNNKNRKNKSNNSEKSGEDGYINSCDYSGHWLAYLVFIDAILQIIEFKMIKDGGITLRSVQKRNKFYLYVNNIKFSNYLAILENRLKYDKLNVNEIKGSERKFETHFLCLKLIVSLIDLSDLESQNMDDIEEHDFVYNERKKLSNALTIIEKVNQSTDNHSGLTLYLHGWLVYHWVISKHNLKQHTNENEDKNGNGNGNDNESNYSHQRTFIYALQCFKQCIEKYKFLTIDCLNFYAIIQCVNSKNSMNSIANKIGNNYNNNDEKQEQKKQDSILLNNNNNYSLKCESYIEKCIQLSPNNLIYQFNFLQILFYFGKFDSIPKLCELIGQSLQNPLAYSSGNNSNMNMNINMNNMNMNDNMNIPMNMNNIKLNSYNYFEDDQVSATIDYTMTMTATNNNLEEDGINATIGNKWIDWVDGCDMYQFIITKLTKFRLEHVYCQYELYTDCIKSPKRYKELIDNYNDNISYFELKLIYKEYICCLIQFNEWKRLYLLLKKIYVIFDNRDFEISLIYIHCLIELYKINVNCYSNIGINNNNNNNNDNHNHNHNGNENRNKNKNIDEHDDDENESSDDTNDDDDDDDVDILLGSENLDDLEDDSESFGGNINLNVDVGVGGIVGSVKKRKYSKSIQILEKKIIEYNKEMIKNYASMNCDTINWWYYVNLARLYEYKYNYYINNDDQDTSENIHMQMAIVKQCIQLYKLALVLKPNCLLIAWKFVKLLDFLNQSGKNGSGSSRTNAGHAYWQQFLQKNFIEMVQVKKSKDQMVILEKKLKEYESDYLVMIPDCLKLDSEKIILPFMFDQSTWFELPRKEMIQFTKSPSNETSMFDQGL